MNSRIEQLIAEIEEFISQCKTQTFSNNNIIVNKNKMEEYLRELRLKTPDEIKRYQKIISNKEAILNDAREKAEALINEATAHTNQLINEHEIMQQAYMQANDVISRASFQAQGILDNAILEANSVKTAATQYLEDVLTHLENIIVSATNSSLANYETLIGSLNQYHDIIQSNLKELHPVDDFDDVGDIAPTEGVKSDINVIAGGVS